MGAWVGDHSLALGALFVYLLLIIGHAWHGHRATSSTADFYIGGRAMGGIALGLSFYATFFSTNSFIGFAGVSYDVGFSSCSVDRPTWAKWHLLQISRRPSIA